MNCPACKAYVPDNLLSCPNCAIAKSDAATIAAQAEYLQRVRSGQWDLRTCRAADGTNHIQMFGTDKAFCGYVLTLEKRRRDWLKWGDEKINMMCTRCRIEVKRAMEDLPSEVLR